jgi:surface polysaccharide O-acyltransferase-like enzyme
LCFAGLVAITALVYLPLLSVVSALHWAAFGPFSLQTSRLFFYALYFFGGIVLGAQGLERVLLAPHGRLARRWPVWMAATLVSYVLTLQATMAGFGVGASAAIRTAANLGFVITCATSCFALLALFLRFVRKPRPMFDSLRNNAYGMYIFHYAIVSWLQLSILPVPLSALGKATVVIAATVLLSWATTAALRQVPALRRVL